MVLGGRCVDYKFLYDFIFGKIELSLVWLGRKFIVESLGDFYEDIEGRF